jgi:hypothetical protein
VAKVFGELAENISVDPRSSFGRVNRHVDLLCGHERSSQSHDYQSETDKHSTYDKQILSARAMDERAKQAAKNVSSSLIHNFHLSRQADDKGSTVRPRQLNY